MSGHRIEEDSLGRVEVARDVYWGAQTQRALENFPIHDELMPLPLIHAFAIQKIAAARANMALGVLDKKRGDAIVHAALRIKAGELNEQFPLKVWQTGSGTQTNMNMNEVIANVAIDSLGGIIGSKEPIHPNDHCNMSQSSNDSFPTAMHIATALALQERLHPACLTILASLAKKEKEFAKIIKVGRTHTQDATPLTLGQVFSAYHAHIKSHHDSITQLMPDILSLAQGASAVGTGLNTPAGFDKIFAQEVSKITKMTFTPADNKFASLAGHDALLKLSGALNGLASSLMKIANDIRLLASGPRSGLGELILPALEPGSSIMPGKVNPTQCEALTQIAAQVMGNHHTISIACSHGQFELNVFKPIIIYNLLQSIFLLADGMMSFTLRCLDGIKANERRIEHLMKQSLMLVTALNKHIGYDDAARIAKKAYDDNCSLREAALALKLVSEQDFDKWVHPQDMIAPYKPPSP